MGAGIAASPHCAERRICRCSHLVKTRRPQPALDPGSPAQASLPIERLPPKRSPTGLPDCAARGFAGPSTDPACQEPKLPAKTVRLSAALLGETALASRFAHRNSEELREPRRARGSFLFRRLIPTDSASAPESFNIACRRRSDLWSPAASACRCRLLERPGPPSRSPAHNAQAGRVAKAKNPVRSLWITGISGTTVGTLSQSLTWAVAIRRGSGCRSVLLSLPPPSA
jgi:hypothetical protein